MSGKSELAIKADSVIFDLDGTLWDSTESILFAWQQTVGRDFPENPLPDMRDIESIMGLTPVQIADYFAPRYGERSHEIAAACLAQECAYMTRDRVRIYDGAETMLAELKRGHRLYIVSNCQKNYIETFLKLSGFARYIDDFECEGNTGNPKSANIRLVIERCGLNSPVYVGDTHIDEASANEAGCPFIHAAYGFGTAQAPLCAVKTPLALLDVIV